MRLGGVLLIYKPFKSTHFCYGANRFVRWCGCGSSKDGYNSCFSYTTTDNLLRPSPPVKDRRRGDRLDRKSVGRGCEDQMVLTDGEVVENINQLSLLTWTHGSKKHV